MSNSVPSMYASTGGPGSLFKRTNAGSAGAGSANAAGAGAGAVKSAKSLHHYGIGRKLVSLSNKADVYLKASSGGQLTQGQLHRAGFITKNANHWSIRWFGKAATKVNSAGVTTANNVGLKLFDTLAKTTPTAIANGTKPGLIARTIAKVPGIEKLATGLTAAKKLPGLGVIFTTAEAVYGYAKAAKLAIWDGDWNGAAHQAIKSTITLGANVAGMALVAGGIVAAPFSAGASLTATAGGLAILAGSDIAGRYVGGKVADFFAGPVDENGHSISYKLEQAYKNGSFSGQSSGEASEMSEYAERTSKPAAQEPNWSNDDAKFNEALEEIQRAAFR